MTNSAIAITTKQPVKVTKPKRSKTAAAKIVPASVPAPVASPAEPPTVKVTFVLPDTTVQRVSVGGDFNGWSPNATPMIRQSNGHWAATVALVPGRHEYKFLVDGQWMPDIMAKEVVWNPYGTLNSVIEVAS